jgi:Ulp1 family protease
MFTLPYADRLRRYTFEPEDIERLAQARGWLNDECVNNLALLIQSKMVHSGEYPKASLCSIFSSFALGTPEEGPRRHNPRTAAILWAHARHLQYWEHPVWIFPIHRPEGHWVSAVVQPRSSRMFLFDSFNNLRAWQSDVNVRILSEPAAIIS